MRLIGVVGHVPSRAFELHGGRGDHLLHLAAALRALLYHPVRKFLDLLEAVTALLALVFVKGHGFGYLAKNQALSILGAQLNGVN
jgi:hypothetical protein